MIWWTMLLVVAYMIYKFFIALNKDNKDLREKRLTERFSVLIETLNNSVYFGEGALREIDERSFNLYNTKTNTILMFFYSTGHLTITWKKNSLRGGDRTFEKQFNDVRNIDIMTQRLMANQFFNEGEAYFKPFGLSGIIKSDDVEENQFSSIKKLFSTVSNKQKMSILNAMLLVAFSDGAMGNKELEAICLNKYLHMFNLDSESVMQYYEDYGIDRMYSDLKYFTVGQKEILTYILIEMMLSDGKPNETEILYSSNLLEKIGVNNDTYTLYIQKYLSNQN